MPELWFFSPGRKRFKRDVEELFKSFDVDRAMVERMLAQTDVEAEKTRIAKLLNQYVPDEFRCRCGGVFIPGSRRWNRRLRCTGFPACEERRDSPVRDDGELKRKKVFSSQSWSDDWLRLVAKGSTLYRSSSRVNESIYGAREGARKWQQADGRWKRLEKLRRVRRRRASRLRYLIQANSGESSL